MLVPARWGGVGSARVLLPVFKYCHKMDEHLSFFGTKQKIIVHKNYNYNVLGLSGHWMEFDSSATAEYYGDCFFLFVSIFM